MSLLDDCVSAEGLVRRDAVEDLRVGGGEERVEPPHVEQGGLACGPMPLGVEVRDPARSL